MISFEPFRIWCAKVGKIRQDIRRDTNLSRPTLDKIWKDELVRTDIIDRICSQYDLRIDEVCVYRKNKE